MLGYFIQYTFLWVEFVGALKFVMGPLLGAEFGPVTVYFFFFWLSKAYRSYRIQSVGQIYPRKQRGPRPN